MRRSSVAGALLCMVPFSACALDESSTAVVTPSVRTDQVAVTTAALDDLPSYFPKAASLSLQQLPSTKDGPTHKLTATLDDRGLAALEAVTGGRDVAVVRGPEADVVLHDDGKKGDSVAGDGVFTAGIHIDPTEVMARAELEEQLAADGQLAELPQFDGYVLTGYASRPPMSSADLADGKSVDLAPLPAMLSQPTFQEAVERSLFITNPLVVADLDRTNGCTNPGNNPDGIWTFAHLMRQMAGDQDPQDFVEHWVEQMTLAQSSAATNGFTTPALVAMSDLLSWWPLGTDGRIDLDQAPFELMAIVARPDLRTRPSSSPYGGGEAAEGGEVRFIFRASPSIGGNCMPRDFTVIFEYGKPLADCPAQVAWAQAWLALQQIDMVNDTATYLAALEALTLTVTEAGGNRQKPNDSAIDQVRIVALETARQAWSIREFHLMGSGWLDAATTAATPDNRFRSQAWYTFFDSLVSSPPTDPVPLSITDVNNATSDFLGAEAVVQFPNDQGGWGSYSDLDFSQLAWSDLRHHRALDTCSGCHNSETDTAAAHMLNPLSGVISPFLVGASYPNTNTPHDVTDPVAPVNTPGRVTRSFFDLLRRRDDLIAMANQLCAEIAVDDLSSEAFTE